MRQISGRIAILAVALTVGALLSCWALGIIQIGGPRFVFFNQTY